MTQFNTGNPIGSPDPRDLFDNAQNLDELVNSESKETHPDRLGKSRKTWHGMEEDFADLLANSAYEILGDYAAGITIESYNQVIRYNGEFYGAKASTDLPYTTDGTWATDEPFLVGRGDAVFRQDLGGVPGVKRIVPDIRALLDLTNFLSGRTVEALGFYPSTKIGGGEFFYDPGMPKSSHNGVTILSPTVPWDGTQATVANFLSGVGETDGEGFGSWVRLDQSLLAPEMAGAVFDGSDDAPSWNALAQAMQPHTKITSLHLGGTTTCASEVLFSKHVNFDLPNITVNMTAGDFKVVGSLTTMSAVLSNNAKKGDLSVSVNDESGFSPGDLIIIQNNDDFSFSAHRAYYHDGEFIEVRDISAGEVHFKTGLKAYYSTSDSIVFYKLTPINLTIRGLNISGDGADRLCYLDLIKDIDIKEFSVVGGVNAALQLRRCFGGVVEGRFKHTGPASGLNYGISIANSQDVCVDNSSAYGTRHGVSTGGFDGDGAVPCRGLRIKRSKVASIDSHGADIHGNAEDCYYIDCDISNGTGIGGKNCGVRGGTVSVPDGYGQTTLMVTELVGGVISFEDLQARMAENSVFSLFGSNSSAVIAKASENFTLRVNNIDAFKPSSNTAVSLGTFVNSADGSVVKNWSAYLTNIRVAGDISSLTRLCTALLTNPLAHAVAPVKVSNLVIDNIEIDHSGLAFWAANSGGAIASGSIVTMPKLTFSGDQTISASGYVSAGLSFNYPSYVITPEITATYTGAGISSSTFVMPLVTSADHDSVSAVITSMHTTETVSVDTTARVNVKVGFDNFAWP